LETIINTKKERIKLTPEQLFDIYLECNAPGAPVKTILERYGLRPWDLIAIRKKIKAAAMEALAHPGKLGRKHQVIPVEQYQKVSKELDNTKDALAAVGHELALLKKKTS
jgi:DNA-directed RNA polymerase subunit H (RpoH/RPB5)